MDDNNIFNTIQGAVDNPPFAKPNMPTEEIPIIKVLGVGGGGGNAINHMYKQNVSGVSFVVANTDRQALETSPVPNRLLLGPNTTKGLGAGNQPEIAKRAAEESADDINALFDDGTRMVFITAGMGGGTGTGAAPVVAKIARERDVLTIGIVTIPFLFEGQKKILKALKGADEMKKYVDALLIINNERLTEIYPDLNLDNAYGKADDTLSVAARSISELITVNGRINLDFMDVNTTLRNGGVAVISSGLGEGENRVTKAINDALNSPLLRNCDIHSSKRILFNLYYSRNAKKPFQMSEAKEINKFMASFGIDVDVIWGQAYDDELGDKVRITILAAGFDMSLDNEAAPRPESKTPEEEHASEQEINRLKVEYGDRIDTLIRDKAEARAVVLRPDQFDNDDVIAQLENNPAFKRDDKFNNEIKNLGANSSPSSEQSKAKTPAGKTGDTILFE